MLSLIMAVFGGLLYRWRGHASNIKKYFPRPFNQTAFAMPYAAAVIPFWWGVLPVWILTTLGVLTGHGRGISLSDPICTGS